MSKNERHFFRVRYDRRAILAAWPVPEVLAAFGAFPLSHLGARMRGPCPLCRTSQASKAFTVLRSDPVYFSCFACGERGSSVDLWAALSRVSLGEAFRAMGVRAGMVPGAVDEAAFERLARARSINAQIARAQDAGERRRALRLIDDARALGKAADYYRDAGKAAFGSDPEKAVSYIARALECEARAETLDALVAKERETWRANASRTRYGRV